MSDNYNTTTAAALNREAHDPRTDARACTLCLCEDVTEAATMCPSGVAPQITCSKGHTTNGMPTAAYFAS